MNSLSGAVAVIALAFASTQTSVDRDLQSNGVQQNVLVRSDGFNGNEASQEKVERIAREKILYRQQKTQIGKWQALKAKKQKFQANVSAYTAAADECGKSDGITASGVHVQSRRTLACPPQYPFGTKIHIDGVGTFVCEDRGGAIKGNHFDIYMKTKKEAFAFGRRILPAYVVQ